MKPICKSSTMISLIFIAHVITTSAMQEPTGKNPRIILREWKNETDMPVIFYTPRYPTVASFATIASEPGIAVNLNKQLIFESVPAGYFTASAGANKANQDQCCPENHLQIHIEYHPLSKELITALYAVTRTATELRTKKTDRKSLFVINTGQDMETIALDGIIAGNDLKESQITPYQINQSFMAKLFGQLKITS